MKKIYFLLLLVSGFAIDAFSQFGNSDEGNSNSGLNAARAPYCWPCKKRHYGGCTPPPTNHNVPIDGGLGVLLAAGALYGVRRIRNKKATTN